MPRKKAEPTIEAARRADKVNKAQRYIVEIPPGKNFGRGTQPCAVLANVVGPNDDVFIVEAWLSNGQAPVMDSIDLQDAVLAEERRRRDERRTRKAASPRPTRGANTDVWANRDVAADGDGGRGPSGGASCGETDGGH